jgi:hypothetical protein
MAKDIQVKIKVNTSSFQKGVMTIMRGLYQIDGSPYGDTDEGFWKWMEERKNEDGK